MKKSVWQEKYQLLASELRILREQTGLTQSQLAARLGKPQSYVSKYESADKYLSFVEVLAVCEAISVHPVKVIEKMGFTFEK